MQKNPTTRAFSSHFSLTLILVVVGVLQLLLSLPAAGQGPYRRPGLTERESVTASGAQAAGAGYRPAASADGRYVVFYSDADNLTPLGGNSHLQVYLRDRQSGQIELISVATDGSLSDGDAIGAIWPPWPTPPVITPDGRFVAFHSNATNLVAGDTNGTWDVFVRDRQSGTTERVSVASDGSEGSDYSGGPTITADGHLVAFYSKARLTANDLSGFPQVFLRDRQSGTTELISVNTSGNSNFTDLESFDPAITPDGRYVSFHSLATDLVANDTNNAEDVFVRDRQSGTTELVSKASNGDLGNGPSFFSSISNDGRYVAFASGATNLIRADNKPGGKTADVYLHDRQTGRTERVSVSSAGVEGDQNSEGGVGYDATVTISGDGRYVAFYSFSTNHVAADTNGFPDVFVHDALLGITERVDVATDGTQADSGATTIQLSNDGRYAAFQSESANLISGDPGGGAFLHDRGPDIGVLNFSAAIESSTFQIAVLGSADFAGAVLASAQHSPDPMAPQGLQLTGASLVARPELGDLMISLQFPPVVSPGLRPGAPTNVYGTDFNVGGIPYEVRAVGTLPQFALFQCSSLPCTQVTMLAGGFETMADEVRVSVPLSALGAGDGTGFTSIRAFAAGGDIITGPAQIFDQMPLANTAIPIRRVELGIAAAGTSPSQVSFNLPASFNNGNFSGVVNTSGLSGGDYDVWARACFGAICTGGISQRVTVPIPSPVQLLRAVSRQIHGTAGTFDIDLPLSGGPGIECRKSTNQSGLYTVVLTFSDPLVRVDQAVFEFPDPGQGTEIFGDIDSADTHNYIITLFVGFTPRIINMALHNVVDSAGDFSARVPISMGLLIGDVNATGRTDSGDVTAVRNRTISIPDQQTCRFDVNLDGRIDSGDVTVTRNASVTVLP